MPQREAELGALVPLPGPEVASAPETTHTTTFLLSAPSAGTELPPAAPMDTQLGTFPQEPPLDTLPGKQATFRGSSGGKCPLGRQ